MSDLLLPAPWSEFLAEVDQSLSEPVELHCVGGFVLTAVYGIPEDHGRLRLHFCHSLCRTMQDLEKIAGEYSELRKSLLAKLTRNNPKDIEDVAALARKFNLKFDVLMQRFQTEMTVPRREWHEQTLNVVWKDYFNDTE